MLKHLSNLSLNAQALFNRLTRRGRREAQFRRTWGDAVIIRQPAVTLWKGGRKIWRGHS
jgi:hypothetical protein